MTGEYDLAVLFAGMEPVLGDDIWLFVTLPDRTRAARLDAILRFEEAEGTTLIVTEAVAQAEGLDGVFPSRMITLNVHSALEAVGFLAPIATRLAAEGMGVNPVAGFFHDHLFIPADRAEDAMRVLRAMRAEGQPSSRT
ncbi:ACT domain-containing protein [Jannaschia donghaensis]|uniref:ACT domain protein n=1 Tax=Jannaschia donghaensis TaxID=420998 RepID=A0A0M6YIJ0_9RHOB|nr:ACT domain-containing protein [Jannaschia donghaensis]CTQ49744.1 ACT domain protein [Jannaschia donghaensis]